MNKLGQLFLILIALSTSIFAQEQITEKTETAQQYGIKFSGFVRSDIWIDSRKNISAREDIFTIAPLPENLDRNGVDNNANSSFNFSAITTRLRGKISGPDAFGAKTSGLIESDFSGATNGTINLFRLRHAYVKLNWEHSELLIGQYWHPMFVTEAFPSVTSLNTGSPFNPFIRNPQVRFTYKLNKIKLIAVVLSERDHQNLGYIDKETIGKSPIFMSNTLVPNTHLQIQYKGDKNVFGLGADYKMLMPRTLTDSNIVTRETIGTYALMAYQKYNSGKFTLKSKFIYGQNLTEQIMFGGYAVSSLDSLTDKRTYTPLNNIATWINMLYGDKIIGGLFLGYTKTLGAKQDITDLIGFGTNIDKLYRIAPSITFVSNKLRFSTEVEYTVASYGTPNIKAVVKDTKDVVNIKLLFVATYCF